jgi:hypothetical protein
MGDKKPLVVKNRCGKIFARVIETRPVTYICQECGQEVTEELYPGPAPKICFGCQREVNRCKAAERQRRFRAARAEKK